MDDGTLKKKNDEKLKLLEFLIFWYTIPSQEAITFLFCHKMILNKNNNKRTTKQIISRN